MPLTAQPRPDPRRYFEAVGDARGQIAEQEPVCLYIETTNRCNLLCETCPRTFEDLGAGKPADNRVAIDHQNIRCTVIDQLDRRSKSGRPRAQNTTLD